MRLPRRPLTRILLVVLLVGGIAAVLARRPLLSSAGALLIVEESAPTADVAVMTTEAGHAGLLELADLYQRKAVVRVAVLTRARTRATREIERRGVILESPVTMLAVLGVPASAVITIPAGEGGTTEGTASVAAWCAGQNIHRLMIVTSMGHSRRIQRAMRRSLKGSGPEVIMHPAPYDAFRPATWWQNRTTLREGLVELQKLLLDYVSHPLG